MRERSRKDAKDAAAGPRAILRVPEVLIALASRPAGKSLAELSAQLELPKTSLHRLLRTLERGGYLMHHAGVYLLGPASFHLASVIGKAAPPTTFPACARPAIERLAHDTHETVMLGALDDRKNEITYVDVIDSDSAVRFTVPVGDRRPLFSAASGKAVLAFLPSDEQQSYMTQTKFTKFTPYTSGKSELRGVLREVRERAVAFDRGGKVVGASAIASPIFDRDGKVFASVSAAGPTERIEANRAQIETLVLEAGERISRVLGYSAVYPPVTRRTTRGG